MRVCTCRVVNTVWCGVHSSARSCRIRYIVSMTDIRFGFRMSCRVCVFFWSKSSGRSAAPAAGRPRPRGLGGLPYGAARETPHEIVNPERGREPTPTAPVGFPSGGYITSRRRKRTSSHFAISKHSEHLPATVCSYTVRVRAGARDLDILASRATQRRMARGGPDKKVIQQHQFYTHPLRQYTHYVMECRWQHTVSCAFFTRASLCRQKRSTQRRKPLS